MTDEELEKTILCDLSTLAQKLGSDILQGLAKSYPREFSLWVADLKFKRAPRFAMGFEARLQPVDEARADLILTSDTIGEREH